MASKQAKSSKAARASQAGNLEHDLDKKILSINLNEHGQWKTFVGVIAGEHVGNDYFVNQLLNAIKSGKRKLFKVIERSSIYNDVNIQQSQLLSDNKPSKGKGKGDKETAPLDKSSSLASEILNMIKSLEENKEVVPVDLVAKLIKAKLLQLKDESNQIYEPIAAAPSRSAKTLKGKKEGAVSSRMVNVVEKETTSIERLDGNLIKRSNDQDSVFINDELQDGPNQYVILAGFHEPNLVLHLSEIGIVVDSVFKVKVDPNVLSLGIDHMFETESSEKMKQELLNFWKFFLSDLTNPMFKFSMQDILLLEIDVKPSMLSFSSNPEDFAALVQTNLFNNLANQCYNIINKKQHWKTYLQTGSFMPASMPMFPVNTETGATECIPFINVDMQMYKSVLDSIPNEGISVPLIIFAMIEQICCSEDSNPGIENIENGNDISEVSSTEDSNRLDIEKYFEELACSIALTREDKIKFDMNHSVKGSGCAAIPIFTVPKIINFHDEINKRLNTININNFMDLIDYEMEMLKYRELIFRIFEKSNLKCDTSIEFSTRYQELLHFCTQLSALSLKEIGNKINSFLFESLNIKETDDNCRIIDDLNYQPSPFWDDPYNVSDYVIKKFADANEEVTNIHNLLSQNLRNMDEYLYTEVMPLEALLQKMIMTAYTHPHIDTYLKKQDNSILIVMNNPYHPKLRFNIEEWHAHFLTNSGFRNFYIHICNLIEDWLVVEEIKAKNTQAKNKNQNLSNKKEETAEQPPEQKAKTGDKKDKTTKSPTKDLNKDKKGRKSTDTKDSEEVEKNIKDDKDLYINPKSLKAYQVQQMNLKNQDTVNVEEKNEIATKIEELNVKTIQLNGYDIGDKVVNVDTTTTSLFTSDGGIIKTEQLNMVQENFTVRCSILKNGNIMSVHQVNTNAYNFNAKLPSNDCGDSNQTVFTSFTCSFEDGMMIAVGNQSIQETTDLNMNADKLLKSQDSPAQYFQQMFITCPDGLQVSFMQEYNDGGCEFVDKKIYVKQKFVPLENSAPSKVDEFSRIITQEGIIVKTMNDGGLQILYSDGKVTDYCKYSPLFPYGVSSNPLDQSYAYSNKSLTSVTESTDRDGDEGKESVWITTTPAGGRYARLNNGTQIPLKAARIFKVTDAHTKKVMYTREDHVIMVCHPDGCLIVEHNDGTRISSQQHIHIQPMVDKISNCFSCAPVPHTCFSVENPQFAKTFYDLSCMVVEFGNGTVIKCSKEGEYIIQTQNGNKISIYCDGRVTYECCCRENNNPECEICADRPYVMNFIKDNMFETVDSLNNYYTVERNGQSKVVNNGNNANISIGETGNPQFFVINNLNTGFQILKSKEVEDIIDKMRKEPKNLITVENIDKYDNIVGINILQPFKGYYKKWGTNYCQQTIIPEGLENRNLMNLPGRASSKSTARMTDDHEEKDYNPTLLMRQFYKFPETTNEIRYALNQSLLKYAEFKENKNKYKQNQIEIC